MGSSLAMKLFFVLCSLSLSLIIYSLNKIRGNMIVFDLLHKPKVKTCDHIYMWKKEKKCNHMWMKAKRKLCQWRENKTRKGILHLVWNSHLYKDLLSFPNSHHYKDLLPLEYYAQSHCVDEDVMFL